MIIVQLQSEKMVWEADFEEKNFTKGQILNLKKYDASDFDSKTLQRVRFWIEKNTTR